MGFFKTIPTINKGCMLSGRNKNKNLMMGKQTKKPPHMLRKTAAK